MLDLFGIVFSSGIMILVILRAVQLDVIQPWFHPRRTEPDNSGLRLRPGATPGPRERNEAVPDWRNRRR